MNKQLVGRIFDLPDNVIKHLQTSAIQYPDNGIGIKRCELLLSTRQVNYNQLKRILHDLKYIDKKKDFITYNLWGGEPMETWATQILSMERDTIKKNKKATQMAHSIGGIDGITKNPFNSTHEKKDVLKIPTNVMKSNSDKTSVSPLVSSMKLFEEINKIKKLM